jgi:predicted acylesterase/phospholipase RssA
MNRSELCLDLLNTQTLYPRKPFVGIHSLSSPRDIDIVISGGGLKGYFVTGCSHVLLHELKKHDVVVQRIAGASAGAWCGLFMLTGFPTKSWLETYYLFRDRPDMFMHEAYDDLWSWISAQLPDDAWSICSGRLFISITEITMFGLKNRVVSEFSSNRDIFDACLASSTVPFITLPTICRKYKNMHVLDGGFTNSTPIFPDMQRRQLVIQLDNVFYPTNLMIRPHDQCIESLVLRGAIQISNFLQGESIPTFKWIAPSNEQDFRSISFVRKYFMMIVTIVGGMVYMRSELNAVLSNMTTTFSRLCRHLFSTV